MKQAAKLLALRQEELRTALMNKKVLAELKLLHEKRGIITKSQVEYSRTEIRALKDIYPLIKPADDVRHSNNRTLDSYMSVNALSLEIMAEE